MSDRPNILLVVTEQHRGDCLGCDGHPVLLTPNMDNIARNGARFRRFYTDCPVCMPARRTILSGQHPASHGLFANVGGLEWDTAPPTLPQTLRDAGYQTRWIGRDMHQFPVRARYGYDEIESGGGRPDSDYIEWLEARAPEDSGGVFGAGVMHNDWTARPWPLDEYLTETNWVVTRALEFLRKRDTTCPFFLTLSFLAAHPPLQPPACYFERYLRSDIPEPFVGDWAEPPSEDGPHDVVAPSRVRLEGEALRSARAGYYGLVNHIDDQLRRVLNGVLALSHRSDTVVCLTSDHGEMLGDHYHWRKQVPYESSARIPFLLSAPPALGVEPGTVVDAPATLADVMPTLLDFADVDIPDTVDGRSLRPLMSGGDIDREWVHIECHNEPHALTDGCEKYVWDPSDGLERLFDLDADPHELHDRAADPDAGERLELWRGRLVEKLADRPEGFVENGALVPGRERKAFLPHGGTHRRWSRERFRT